MVPTELAFNRSQWHARRVSEETTLGVDLAVFCHLSHARQRCRTLRRRDKPPLFYATNFPGGSLCNSSD